MIKFVTSPKFYSGLLADYNNSTIWILVDVHETSKRCVVKNNRMFQIKAIDHIDIGRFYTVESNNNLLQMFLSRDKSSGKIAREIIKKELIKLK